MKNDNDDSVNTKITKISNKKVFIERFWPENKIKFSGYYLEMPEKLIGKPNGAIFFTKEYVTGESNRDGIAIWYHENGNIHKKYNYKDGWLIGSYEIFWESGNIRVKGQRTRIDNEEEVRIGIWKDYDEEGNITLKKDYSKQV